MSRFFALKTNAAFTQTIFWVIIAVSAIFILSIKTYHFFILYLNVLIHKIKDACGCTDMAQFFSMHPDISRLVIILSIGIGIFIIYSLHKLIKLILETKKYAEYYLSFAKAGHSIKLKSAIKALNLDKARIIEIDKPDAAAFCFGFWRPKICVSRILADTLTKNELMAVLSHESQHMFSNEPLKVFIIKYFNGIFFFLPGFKLSTNKYMMFSELAADEKASENSKSLSSLASAMLKISEQKQYRQFKGDSSLSFFGSTIEERANRLSDAAYVPKFKFLNISLIFGSIGLISISVLVFLILSDSTKAFEMYNGGSCISMDSLKNNSVCGLMARDDYHNADSGAIYRLAADGFPQNSVCKIK